MTRADDPGPEHDAYLRSALRHAPDAALGPPEALDDAILRRARSATADAGAASTAHVPLPRQVRPDDRSPDPDSAMGRILSGLASGWSWLARPSVATGFAGVMVATLVGVMWWGRPLDEAMPRRFEPPATTAAPSTDSGPTAAATRSDPAIAQMRPTSPETTAAGSSAAERQRLSATAPRTDVARPDLRRSAPEVVASAPSTATSPAMPDRLTKRQAEPSAFPAPADAPVDTRTRELRAGLERDARRESDASKARSTEAAGEPVAPPSPAGAPRSIDRFEVAAPRPAAAPAASPPPPAVADAVPDSRSAPSSAAAQTDSTAVQKSRVAPERLAGSPVAPPIASADAPAASAEHGASNRNVVGALEDRQTGRADASHGSAGAIASSRIGPSTRSPLAPLRAALVTDPARWTWSGDGRRVQRVTPALLAWLSRLDAALAAPPADSRGSEPSTGSDDATPAEAPKGPVRTLVLLHEGRRHTELRLGAALDVTPIDPPGPRWRAALAPEDSAALRDSLPQ